MEAEIYKLYHGYKSLETSNQTQHKERSHHKIIGNFEIGSLKQTSKRFYTREELSRLATLPWTWHGMANPLAGQQSTQKFVGAIYCILVGRWADSSHRSSILVSYF